MPYSCAVTKPVREKYDFIFSPGNEKIGNTLNFSTSPIASCGKLKVFCKEFCYACKSYKQYDTVKAAWDHNFKYLRKKQYLKLEQGACEYISRKKYNKYFRWYVSGDILNQHVLNVIYNVAEMKPRTEFLVFTKRFDLRFRSHANCPPNLTIVFSYVRGMEALYGSHPAGYPVSYVDHVFGDHSEVNDCADDCEACRVCWYLPTNSAVLFHQH